MTTGTPEKNVWVAMQNNHLTLVHDHVVDRPYRIKWYEPGDEDKWVEVQTAAEAHVRISMALYRSTFLSTGVSLANRQCFFRSVTFPTGV